MARLNTSAAPNIDSDGDFHLKARTLFVEAGKVDFGEGAITNVVVAASVAVTIPSFAADTCDSVAVDVDSAFTAAISVGDVVQAAPLEALPESCLFLNAYVSATNTITCVFGSAEGAGVTGAAKAFKFVVTKASASV